MEINEIKNYLKINKISYSQLAQKSGVHLNTLKQIFSGKTPHPRIDTMQAIEKALNLDTEEEITDYFCHVLPQTALDFWDEKGEFVRFKLNTEDWQTLYNLAEKLATDKAGKKYWNKE